MQQFVDLFQENDPATESVRLIGMIRQQIAIRMNRYCATPHETLESPDLRAPDQ